MRIDILAHPESGKGKISMPKRFPNGKSGYIMSDDSTCWVVCSCDNDVDETTLFVSDNEIVRCPKCGRGYKTEFVVWVYEKDEDDTASKEIT